MKTQSERLLWGSEGRPEFARTVWIASPEPVARVDAFETPGTGNQNGPFCFAVVIASICKSPLNVPPISFMNAVAYQDASKSLHCPSPLQSRSGLDWMNFFVAGMQTGFGPYAAFYLAQNGWSEGDACLSLTVGGFEPNSGSSTLRRAELEARVGRGWNCFHRRSRADPDIVTFIRPDSLLRAFARSHRRHHHTRAIGAISLELMGPQAMSMRTGRNYRYAVGGHAIAAAVMELTRRILLAWSNVRLGGCFVRSNARCAQLHPT
jgi:hypothetical protein